MNTEGKKIIGSNGDARFLLKSYFTKPFYQPVLLQHLESNCINSGIALAHEKSYKWWFYKRSLRLGHKASDIYPQPEVISSASA